MQTVDTAAIIQKALRTRVWDQITGMIDPAVIIAGMLFVLLGVGIMTYISIKKRDANSPRTPVDFNLGFFLRDTLPRLIASCLFSMAIAFVAIRFSNDVLGRPLTMALCLGIGLAFDRVSQAIVAWSNKISWGGNTTPPANN